jgi:hypothetical protein
MEIVSVLNDDDTVFHYTKMSTAIEHILFEKRLRFSKSIKTNDPREYNDWDLGVTEESSNNEDFLNQSVLAMNKVDQVRKSDYKLACFCSNRFPESTKSARVSDYQTRQLGYDRLRMWSQYGDKFYGVCIAFSASSVQQRLHEQLGKNAIIYADHVAYEPDLNYKDRPIRDIKWNDINNIKDINEFANEYVRGWVKEIFFTKHVDYRDENEYRIVVHDPNNSFKYLDNIVNCFKAVLLGDRFNLVYQKLIRGFCDELNIECKRVKWLHGKLQLSDID